MQVGGIIYSGLLECPLNRYKKMIEQIEALPLFKKLPVTVSYLSLAQPTGREDLVSSNIIAQIVESGQSLAIRYTYEGFNKKYIVSTDCSGFSRRRDDDKSERGAITGLLYKLRRISSRNELTYQVIRGIIQWQGEYLRTGNPLDLVQLTQVALTKAISSENRVIDNSWISRLIGGLSVITPSGEEKALKFFFPTNKQVNKFFIRYLLDKESEELVSGRLKKPYSDEQIRDILTRRRTAKDGRPNAQFSLSRRSVAHCRREMGIPVSKNRLSGYLMANFSTVYNLTVESVLSNTPSSPGVYELRLVGKEVQYPKGKTPIIYIGSSRNIKKRLREHLRQNGKNGHIKDYLSKFDCSFRYIQFSKNWKDEERKLYQLFVSTYGAAPKGNRVMP